MRGHRHGTPAARPCWSYLFFLISQVFPWMLRVFRSLLGVAPPGKSMDDQTEAPKGERGHLLCALFFIRHNIPYPTRPCTPHTPPNHHEKFFATPLPSLPRPRQKNATSDLFEQLGQMPGGDSLSVHVSFFEIYGGRCQDLLNHRYMMYIQRAGRRGEGGSRGLRERRLPVI